MPTNVAVPPAELYLVDPKAIDDLELRRSGVARGAGANEHDYHSSVLMYPELVNCSLGEGLPLVWRKETRLSTASRTDLTAFFHGRSRCDLIECKGHKQPIIRAKRVTRHLGASLQRLADYRDDFASVGPRDCRLKINIENRPRLVLIGEVEPRDSLTVQQQAVLIDSALRSSDKWKPDLDRELLVVTTWDMLVKNAENAKTIPTSRWCNNFVRHILGNIAHDAENERNSLPSLDEFMTRAVKFMKRAYSPEVLASETLVQARARDVLEALKQLQVSSDKELDTTFLPGQFQLVDWMLYQNDGDMCCGEWVHGSTYMARNVLNERPSLWTEVADHFLKALAGDHSLDVLGRTSHILRYAPEQTKKLLVDNPAIRTRWRFPHPEELIVEGDKRRDLTNFMQVGYLLALHGVAEAIEFMNQAAETPRVIQDLSLFDSTHANEDPAEMLKSLRKKAKDPTEEQKPFLRFHKAIYEANRAAFRRLRMIP